MWFGQSTYTRRLLDKFGMAGSKPVSTPADPESRLVKRTQEEAADPKLYQAPVGGLLYLSTKTRPDIAFAVGNAARFSSDPSKAHWQAVKHIMRCLQGSVSDIKERWSQFSRALATLGWQPGRPKVHIRLQMELQSAGAVRNRPAWPCPWLRPNTSRYRRPHRRPSGFVRPNG